MTDPEPNGRTPKLTDANPPKIRLFGRRDDARG